MPLREDRHALVSPCAPVAASGKVCTGPSKPKSAGPVFLVSKLRLFLKPMLVGAYEEPGKNRGVTPLV